MRKRWKYLLKSDIERCPGEYSKGALPAFVSGDGSRPLLLLISHSPWGSPHVSRSAGIPGATIRSVSVRNGLVAVMVRSLARPEFSVTESEIKSTNHALLFPKHFALAFHRESAPRFLSSTLILQFTSDELMLDYLPARTWSLRTWKARSS